MAAKKKNWVDSEIELLIDLYEQSPGLWDIFDKSYQKRDVKEKRYADISEELQISYFLFGNISCHAYAK